MIIDENEHILLPVKNMLEYHYFFKFEIDTYSNVQQALSSFNPDLYDLVLIGVRMCPMNGFEVCQKLQKKTLQYKSKPKFGFITTFYLYRQILEEDYPELKVGCFIVVPMEPDKLANIIEEVLER